MALLGSAFLAPAAGPVMPAVQPYNTWAERVAAPAASAAGVAGIVSLGAVAGAFAAVSERRQRGRVARNFFNVQTPVKRVAGPLALPMLPEPAFRNLNDELMREADAGFDPLALATGQSQWGNGEDSYYNYREAEVKHGGRPCLLCVFGVEEVGVAACRSAAGLDSLKCFSPAAAPQPVGQEPCSSATYFAEVAWRCWPPWAG